MPHGRSQGRVELREVYFAYPTRPDVDVCRNYSLVVEPGEVVALVGPSGCGKSTIMSLLLRFYDPRQGQVLLDGIDIRTLNVRWLRAQLGYVGQEPVLFAGSIAENIARGIDVSIASRMSSKLVEGPTESGKVSPSLMNLVRAAAKLANADDFISAFPNGYDTDVGPGGAALSGGQKQRIAIARALVRRPAVLLLDEATSALDAASERLVQESIDQLQQAKMQTTLVIAHRLSTIRNADKIAVVNNGQVKELGKHEELLALNGIYADLIHLQLSDPTLVQAFEEGDTASGAMSYALGESKDTKGTNKKHSQSKLVVKGAGGQKEVEESSKEAVVAPLVSKEEAKVLRRRAWALVWQRPIWLLIALFGSAVVGAMFPLWGYLLAHAQDMFFYTDTQKLRDRSVELATYFCLLSAAALVGSTLQFLGVSVVRK